MITKIPDRHRRRWALEEKLRDLDPAPDPDVDDTEPSTSRMASVTRSEVDAILAPEQPV